MHPFSGHQLALAERAPAPIRLSKSEVLPLYSSSRYQPARGHTCHPSTKSDKPRKRYNRPKPARKMKGASFLIRRASCVFRTHSTGNEKRSNRVEPLFPPTF